MPRSINITGSSGKQYDLEELSTKNTRTDSSEELVVHIWYWNPDGIESYKEDETKYSEHTKPNPPNPQLGQIWLSKLVPTDFVEV